MKGKKRVLSAVLAATMLVTSLSAGLSALAAETNEDPYQTLVDALQADGVQNAEWPSEDTSKYFYSVEDPTGDIEKAAEAFWAVATEEAPNHAKKEGDVPTNTVSGVRDVVLEKLQQDPYNVTGDQLTVATNALKVFTGYMNGANKNTGTIFGAPDEPQERTYGVKIIRDLDRVLMSYSKVEDLPEELPLSVSYEWHHGRQEFKEGGFVKTYCANNYLKPESEGGWNRTETDVNTEIPAALKAFGAFFDKHLDEDLDALTGDELRKIYDKSMEQVDALAALGLWDNDEVIDHFFGKDAIQDFINSVEVKVDIAYAREYVSAIQELMKADVGTLELDALNELYTQLNEQVDNLNGCLNGARQAALDEAGLTMEQIEAYIASVNEEIEVKYLTEWKTAVDDLTQIDLSTSDADLLISVYANTSEYLTLINACTPEAIARVFAEGTEYIKTFIGTVYARLGDFTDKQAIADDIMGYYTYFNFKELGQDLTALETEALIDKFGEANQKLGALNATYGKDFIEKVFGKKYDDIVAYVERIRQTLIDRLDAQLDDAIGKYEEYNGITILNYKKVNAAIGSVERTIATVEGLQVPEDVQTKLARLDPMLEEYEKFLETKGLSSWQKTEIEYPTRESMPGDIARGEDEQYQVTEDKVNQVIGSLDGLMSNEDIIPLLESFGVSGLNGATVSEAIKNLINDNLYTDATVNAVVTAIYPMLLKTLQELDIGDMQWLLDVLDRIGLDIVGLVEDVGIKLYPSSVANLIDGNRHPEAKTALQNAGTNWDAYDDTVTWNVTDAESFAYAVSDALSGFEAVLKTVLTDKDFRYEKKVIINVLTLDLDAMNVYSKDALPLLELLGCENLMSVEEYNTKTTAEDLLVPILLPLLNLIDTVAENPVSSLLELLPKLSYLMEFDLIKSHLENIKIDGWIWAIFNAIDQSLGSLLEESLGSNNLYGILSSVLSNPELELPFEIDLNALSDVNKLIEMVLGMVAPDTNLVLPTIDQAYLASLGELKQSDNGNILYTADKPAVLVSVLRYVLNMVGDQDFMNSLFALIGKLTGTEINLGDDVMNILKGLGDNPDGVICALTELFVPYEGEQGNGYAATPYQPEGEDGEALNPVTYSEDWTQDQAQYLADNFDEFVDDIMLILGGSGTPTLGGLIRSYIADQFYTNDTVNTLVITIRDALGGIGIDLAPILDLLDVDLSSWNDVTESTNWGVAPGDSVTFGAALSRALAPLEPLVSYIMTGEDISILGTVTLKGYNGYQNGIIPLLENLGCKENLILPYDEYVSRVDWNQSSSISAILTPILDLVDRIYANPIDTLMEILPNLLYFIHNGGLQACVENTAQSVFVLLDTVRPVYDLNFSLDLDLEQILVDLVAGLEIDGQPLNLKIPFLSDLSLLATGTVEEYTSKSGTVSKHLVVENEADFVTALLRNVVELLFYEDNLNTIGDLIANATGLDANVKENLQKIINVFAELYHQNNGVDKILHAAYVIFKGADQAAGGSIAAIKDFNERWSAIFDQMYQSGGFLQDFAEWADEVLDFLSFGAINGDGVGTNGLVDFFDRLVAFFQGRVTDVSINRTSADMLVGGQTTLSLSFKPVTVKNKNVTWSSSKPSVATVENGVVTAVGVGDVEIKATTEDGGFTVSCVVRVRADKTELKAAIDRVESLGLTGDHAYYMNMYLTPAKEAFEAEYASQERVDLSCESLLIALDSINLGTKVDSVVITQNGSPVGETVYQKVKWTKKWNSTPVTLGVQINGGKLNQDNVRSITWQYADWSVNKPEADIEAAADGMSALIRAKNSVIGAHSCWIQVTVEDNYGNTVTSNPVKVRFYNYDWQK